MAKAKTPDQWTPAYRNRMEKAFAKNPYATKTEARRGSNSKEAKAEHKGNDKHWQERNQSNIKAKLSNVKLREELGVLTPSQARDAEKHLKEMAKDLKEKYEKVTAGSNKDHVLTEKIRANYGILRDEYGVIGDPNEDEFGEIWYPEN